VLAGALALLIEMCESDAALVPNFRALGPQVRSRVKPDMKNRENGY
jgi:hypothetical protein